jgi:uncharacterized protein
VQKDITISGGTIDMKSFSILDNEAELLNHLLLQNGGMTLSNFDGFCAGLIICPDMALPREWLPVVLDDGVEPFSVDADCAENTSNALVGHYNSVAKVLANKPDQYEPIFGIEQNNDGLLWQRWIDGLEHAMHLRPNVWKQMIESDDEEVALSVGMIIAMNDIGHGRSKLDDATIDHIDDIAPYFIPKLVRFLNAWTNGWLSSGLPVKPNIKPNTGNNVVRFH